MKPSIVFISSISK